MRSAVITVGTEILFGQITNTNSVFLSRELNEMGFDVKYHYTVGDNPERLKATLLYALKDCDLIITTGGLGPTQDDLTKETVCEVMGTELVIDENAMAEIQQYFDKINREMTKNNVKQAYIPKSGTTFNNTTGTAPGFVIEREGKYIISLPGPPREMTTMFEKSVRPFLSELMDAVIFSRSLKIFGMGESLVEDALSALIEEQTDPTLATYAKEGEVELRITSKRESLEEAKAAVNEMIPKVDAIMGNKIFSYDGEEYFDVVGNKLIEKNISLACAESCTGGLFASTIAKKPGISAVFDRGLTTYSVRSKKEELGVSQEVVDKYGVFSGEMAEAMAEGLKARSKCRLNIAITGLAGPDTAEGKPVGCYYICCILDDKKRIKEFNFEGRNRNLIRDYMVLSMLDMINKMID